MKTITYKLCLCLLTVFTMLMSCEEDDDPTITFVEEDRDEQQAKDNDSIVDYLSTHYYNSSFFETGTNHKYTDIVITELEEGETVPSGHTLLIDAVGEPLTTTYIETDYEYYILRLNQGGGKSPNFTDIVRVRYEGSSIEDSEVFESTISPSDQPLVGNGFNSFDRIRGWQLVMPSFNTAVDFNFDNGVVNYNNYGLGVMFLPSGLGFFSGISTGSSYDNLIFKFELLQYEEVDHDGDGIPSYLEDLNGDLNIRDDDTDEDEFPNYIDLDDDGDDVLTFDELMQTTYTVDTNIGEPEPVLGDNEYEFSRSSNAGIITIITVKALDTDSNGFLDYLDDGVSVNYNPTN